MRERLVSGKVIIWSHIFFLPIAYYRFNIGSGSLNLFFKLNDSNEMTSFIHTLILYLKARVLLRSVLGENDPCFQ